jgi:hypothetical protein
VHDVRPADISSLTALNTGELDGREVAFVEDFASGQFPVSPATGAVESVTFDSYSDDAMSMQVEAGSDGLLVLSEVYARGWNAWVDGKEVDIYQTDHALRGVPVPAGSHSVELRYTAPGLTAGLWITSIAGAGMLAIWVLFAVTWWRRGRSRLRRPLPPLSGQMGFA